MDLFISYEGGSERAISYQRRSVHVHRKQATKGSKGHLSYAIPLGVGHRKGFCWFFYSYTCKFNPKGAAV